jgi:hypothetical protein
MWASATPCSLIIFSLLLIPFSSCGNQKPADRQASADGITAQVRKKPGSSFKDTLRINPPAAIFFYPDSLQLTKIQEVTDSQIFESNQHEYFYMMKNARYVIKASMPELQIIDAGNYRYLFLGETDSASYIDLDNVYESHGLFIVKPGKKPRLVDMPNIGSELHFYFSDK